MKLLVFLFILGYSNAQTYTFSDDFEFGVATASYQIEGAWNLSGKGENIWDKLTHERSDLIADGSNGDVACDAYHKTKEDVQLLVDLNVDFYRFSISWSRILPTGYKNYINPDGVQYYSNLIDELIKNNIKPMITMYHWDLPQPLQEIGGWPNERLVEYFVDYAELLFDLYGDRVDKWITFNEPIQICYAGYSSADKAPAYTSDGIACYLCGRTLLLAHAKVYHLYQEKYKEKYVNGKVGITIDTSFFGPVDEDSELDLEACDQRMHMQLGWFANPILVGDYPDIMKQRIKDISLDQNFTETRLPEFSAEEIALIKDTTDFLGINHYTSAKCKHGETNYGNNPTFDSDVGISCTVDSSWGTSASSWLRVTPWGFRGLLKWIKNKYDNPEVIITENGYSDFDGVNDCNRVEYYNLYLEELLKAINEDGCLVTGYTAWSFMDNFEWLRGYTERFGIHHVDFEDLERKRTRKMSSYVFENIIKTKAIDWDYIPEDFEECVWEFN